MSGNKKPQTFRNCAQCGVRFGPLPRLSARFCSQACKVLAQTTGRLTRRKTLTVARSAQSLVAYHVKAGNIIKPSQCEECGSDGRIEAAHFDYSRPLDVRWLCVPCHRRWDKREPKGATVVVHAKAA